jgi:hypothetical protein
MLILRRLRVGSARSAERILARKVLLWNKPEAAKRTSNMPKKHRGEEKRENWCGLKLGKEKEPSRRRKDVRRKRSEGKRRRGTRPSWKRGKLNARLGKMLSVKRRKKRTRS